MWASSTSWNHEGHTLIGILRCKMPFTYIVNGILDGGNTFIHYLRLRRTPKLPKCRVSFHLRRLIFIIIHISKKLVFRLECIKIKPHLICLQFFTCQLTLWPFPAANKQWTRHRYVGRYIHTTGCSIWISWILNGYFGFAFGVKTFFPSFLCWKHVYIHIDIWIWYLYCSNFQPSPSLKNEPNHRGNSLKKWKTFYSRYQNIQRFPT